MSLHNNSDKQQAADWWSTNIIQMSPGHINFHGTPIEKLIGKVSFTSMIWFMLRGDLPNSGQEDLFNAALMSSVDHGPQAPSIAIARMASTCGVGINNAMASAINVLGDVHGGAGEQCLQLFQTIQTQIDAGIELRIATQEVLESYFSSGNKYVPGYGHRFHPIDPRSAPLLQLLEKTEHNQTVTGNYSAIAKTVELTIAKIKNKHIPINIDGATAAIYGALGFPAELCRGLFILSRSVGILAHAWEQQQEPTRNKGPLPKGWLWTYTGKDSNSTEIKEVVNREL
ncbi:Citrate synthase [Oligella ureolytica]|uniref:citrate synthase (unknown stereospecificity) n=1 Tax=Oligella ureolytica TaxID=90244 RepID=A0A378XE87_9BURK|nr:citryl-CoA lyase [Oligella ureolytica]QPT40393.1 citryl-CoA lyase [Oligella ureolytica]SUA50943.1 Citrate synthase [Oligella ureolytica]